MEILYTARQSDNATFFPDILAKYVAKGAKVLDMTYGRGCFWRKIPEGMYELTKVDILTGVDFRKLPHSDATFDCVILDPPFMHGGKTIKESLNSCYHSQATSHESIIRLYAGGILEASRILSKKGIIILKTADEIESAKQRMTHIEVISLLNLFGFLLIDFFVLLQKTLPAMRFTYQKTARKNHSYFIVARFCR